MKTKPTFSSTRLALAIATGLFAAAVCGQAQGTLGTISDVPVSGGFDYTILLQDTGSTALNSFWYGWTTSGNNLPAVPANPANSLGWGDVVSGNSIKWVNGSGTALMPGQSGSFTFFSSATPAAMTTPPAGESVAYVHGIDFSQGVAGDSTGVFSPVFVTAPEPSAVGLLALGALGGLAFGWRKQRFLWR